MTIQWHIDPAHSCGTDGGDHYRLSLQATADRQAVLDQGLDLLLTMANRIDDQILADSAVQDCREAAAKVRDAEAQLANLERDAARSRADAERARDPAEAVKLRRAGQQAGEDLAAIKAALPEWRKEAARQRGRAEQAVTAILAKAYLNYGAELVEKLRVAQAALTKGAASLLGDLGAIEAAREQMREPTTLTRHFMKLLDAPKPQSAAMQVA